MSLLTVLLAQRCMLIADTDDLQVECEISSNRLGGESDPCGDGMQCISGICRKLEPCTPPMVGRDPCVAKEDNLLHCDDGYCRLCEQQAEACDGVDNDCDGLIDNGYDNDGDGFTQCGGATPTDQTRDCNDTDPNIHPPSTIEGTEEAETIEICDAIDNDCNGQIDDTAECGMQIACDPDATAPCQSGLFCDVQTRLCTPKQSIGSTCRNDEECGTELCVSANAVELDPEVIAQNFCGKACCTDDACGDGNTCLVPGNGARICVPAAVVSRTLKLPGEQCVRNEECTSDVCRNNRCVTVCARDADCNGQKCVYEPLSFFERTGRFVCGSAQGTLTLGSRCGVISNDCESGLCIDSSCSEPCGSDEDCTVEEFRCDFPNESSGFNISIFESAMSRLPVCIAGTGGEGSASMCCDNDDCINGQTCRAVQKEGSWGMYCE